MSGPYREGPSFLLCPRCGEVLDRAFDDVLACLRCHGIFITPPTAGLAFDDPAWPRDASAMWWKSELECPICANGGTSTIMAAQSFEGTQIDRCAMHGLWLDGGELSRLARSKGDELSFLRNKLHGDGTAVVQLDQKREAWRRDVDARRRAAEEHNAWLAAERKRQIEEADRRQEQERIAAQEHHRIAAAMTTGRVVESLHEPAEPEPKPEHAPRPEPPRQPALTWRETKERDRVHQDRVGKRRKEVMQAIGELENALTSLRMQVREIEGKLAGERARLRALLDE